MKIVKVFYVLFLFSTAVQGAGMNLLDEISTNLQFVISPTSEEEDLSKFDQLTRCVAEFTINNWSTDKINEFSSLLKMYSVKVEFVMNDMNKLIKNGIPQLPPQLQQDIRLLGPTIEHCESKFNIRVEY